MKCVSITYLKVLRLHETGPSNAWWSYVVAPHRHQQMVLQDSRRLSWGFVGPSSARISYIEQESSLAKPTLARKASYDEKTRHTSSLAEISQQLRLRLSGRSGVWSNRRVDAKELLASCARPSLSG